MSGPKPTVPELLAPLVSEAAARIEHEMSNALTAVRGHLGLLLGEGHGRLTPEQRSFASEARRATDRLAGLLDNLLALATVGGAAPHVRKPLSIDALLESAECGLRPLLEERGLAIDCDFEAGGTALRGDSDALERVFYNLLANAARFAPRGSCVRVSTHYAELESGAGVCVAIADEGPGVDAAMAERIFEPFVRGNTGARGVGLGLAVCREVVERHGGRVEAVPALGYGLFRVLLPADEGEPA